MGAEKTIGFVGAGFASAVLARELVENGSYRAVIIDERSHVAGNCHTSRDLETNIMLHQYGPHIFHTSREDVWNYVNKWGKFRAFTNRVKAITAKGIFSLPINLMTINQFFGTTLSPLEAKEFIASLGDKTIEQPKNFEEQALKFLGRELYENFFYGYTKKQWGVEPSQLPASILQRLPVRFNYDDNYYSSIYQGIPEKGYTDIVERILDHPKIKVHLNTVFNPKDAKDYDHLFFSGPLDAFFNFKFGKLQYRSLRFERKEAAQDFQGNAVINYCDFNIPHTRITEHKHFTPWESHDRSVYFYEYSKLAEGKDIPYYPLRLAHDKSILATYVEQADKEKGVTFIGRLGTYRYLDMHVVIAESLDLAKLCLQQSNWPSFSVRPVH